MLIMNCSENLWLFLRAITSWMNRSNFLSKQAISIELMWSAIGIANGDSKTSVTTLLMLKSVALGLDQCQCYLWIALHSIGSCWSQAWSSRMCSLSNMLHVFVVAFLSIFRLQLQSVLDTESSSQDAKVSGSLCVCVSLGKAQLLSWRVWCIHCLPFMHKRRWICACCWWVLAGTWRLIHRLLHTSSWRLLLCSSRLRVILTESVRECWCLRFGRLEEVCKFLLLWWRLIALVTADADYITAVREMGSIAQLQRPWVWQVRLRSTQSTLWSVHIGQVGGRRVIRSCIHLTIVLSRVHNNEEWDWSLDIWYMSQVTCRFLQACRIGNPQMVVGQVVNFCTRSADRLHGIHSKRNIPRGSWHHLHVSCY